MVVSISFANFREKDLRWSLSFQLIFPTIFGIATLKSVYKQELHISQSSPPPEHKPFVTTTKTQRRIKSAFPLDK